MQRLTAMIWLTLKAALRYRLVWVLTALLMGGVVLLPLIVKDDGSARGFTQILLTYTLALTTGLLGFATLWLACGTLARDVEECQIQVVATKPISRWEIWLGKFLGLMTLNALLLGLAGVCIFALLQWRAKRLPEKQQEILRNEVFVARSVAREPDMSAEVEAESKRIFQDRIQKMREQGTQEISKQDLDLMQNQIREQVKAFFQLVAPGYRREWKIDLGSAAKQLKDQPLYLRVKFNSAQYASSGATFAALWIIGDRSTPRVHQEEMSLAPETFHEFKVPPNLIGDDGVLTVNFVNQNEAALLFPLEDGFEVLYREGRFSLNFVRGLVIIFLWLAFLGAIGLAASSFLSFPVAAFVSIGVLIVGFSSGTISQIIEQGTVGEVNHETGKADAPMWLDHVALPMFKALLNLINLVQGFSPIDSLSAGRSISWGQLGLALGQIGILLCVPVSLLGIWIFTRRELATAQGTT